MTPEPTIAFDKPLPVFPLPNSVLLPHTPLPLNIFEPRYVNMITDALDHSGHVAMALYEGALAHEDTLTGRPPLRPYVCLGHIDQYEALNDGRYVVILNGLCRAELVREVAHKPYRRFHLRPMTQRPHNAKTLALAVHELGRLVNQPGLNRMEPVQALRAVLRSGEQAHEALIDTAIGLLCLDTEQRYVMLAEPSPLKRARWIIRHLEILGAKTGKR